MVKIVAELRYSETAFIKRLNNSKFFIRYFLPVSPFFSEQMKTKREQSPFRANVHASFISFLSQFQLDGLYSAHLNIREQETTEYIRGQAEQACRLIHAVSRRKETLLAIGRCIAEHQSNFFIKGDSLNPLMLSDIARSLSLNSSTISRGIHGKYLLFSGKVYPLRSFLSNALASGHSADQVKARIAEILLLSAGKRISDRIIAEKLVEMGIDVSRRTVNKYRREISDRNHSVANINNGNERIRTGEDLRFKQTHGV